MKCFERVEKISEQLFGWDQTPICKVITEVKEVEHVVNENLAAIESKLFAGPALSKSYNNLLNEAGGWVRCWAEDLSDLNDQLSSLEWECRGLRKLERRMNKYGLWDKDRYLELKELHADIVKFYEGLTKGTENSLFKVEEDCFAAKDLLERSQELQRDLLLQLKKRERLGGAKGRGRQNHCRKQVGRLSSMTNWR